MEQSNSHAESLAAYSNSVNLTMHEMQVVIDNMPNGVILFAGSGEQSLLYANDIFYRISGYDKSDLLGKTCADILESLIPSEDMEQVLHSLSERNGSDVWLELRIQKKDGSFAWVRFSVGSLTKGAVCCTFTDITREKTLQQELQMQQERYRIITEQLNDIFFEYNFINDTLTASSQWEELFGYRLNGKHAMASILSDDYIYDDDKEVITRVIDRANRGLPTSELEVRIRRAGGGYIWTSVSTTIICDEIGNPVKVIGKISDIDERKREREKLISNAQRDPLTGLYNKVAVESYIRTCLRASDDSMRHALMIIDVDNFKGVNDSLGHLFGDTVLREISSKLRTLFRSTDILGRFGGDEFIVFLKNVGGNQQISQKAEAICDIFRETYTGENKDYKISGSVGVSVFPEQGSNFYELFKHADTALYEAKNRGKDGFVICGEPDGKEPADKQEPASQQSARHTQSRMEHSIVTDVYAMLNEPKDAHDALQFILKLIGREFLADRVLIFEKDEVFHKSFEWCAENKKLLKGKDVYGDFGYAMRRFREDGFYYCPDVALEEEENDVTRALKANGVKSVLQCPIFESDELTAVVGLEGSLPWPIDERRILVEVCRITGKFISKYRAEQKLRKELALLRAANKNAGLWSYAIEPDTWKLQYVSSVVADAAPEAKPGELCFKALRNRDSVCENCPAVESQATSHPAEAVLFDRQRGQWFRTKAAAETWDGKKSVLLSASDVTRFIKQNSELL